MGNRPYSTEAGWGRLGTGKRRCYNGFNMARPLSLPRTVPRLQLWVWARRFAPAFALPLILAAALALRLYGIDWDQGGFFHPDERFLSLVLGDIRPVDGLLTYFDQAASPLNPSNHGVAFFVYGTFPLFLVEWLTRLTGLQGYDQAYLVGRAISALVDTGTVILVFVLGRRLLGIGPALQQGEPKRGVRQWAPSRVARVPRRVGKAEQPLPG